MYKKISKIGLLIWMFCLGYLSFPIQAKELAIFEDVVLDHTDNPNSQDNYLSPNTNEDNPFAPHDAKKDDSEEEEKKEKEEKEETETEKNEKKKLNFFLYHHFKIYVRFNLSLEFCKLPYSPKLVFDPYHQALYILYRNLRN